LALLKIYEKNLKKHLTFDSMNYIIVHTASLKCK